MAVLQPPAPGRRAMTDEERNYLLLQRLRSLIKHAVLIVFGIAFMLPFVWMISSSVKPNIDIFEIPVRLIPKSLRFENYIDATEAIPFWQYLWNSTYYTIFATIGAVLSNHLHRIRLRPRTLARTQCALHHRHRHHDAAVPGAHDPAVYLVRPDRLAE